jgi:hypothetical protein
MKSCDVITCSRKLSSLFIRRKEVVCCFLFNRHSYFISLNEKNESNEKEVGGLAIRSIRVKQPHRKERKKSRSSFYCSRFHPTRESPTGTNHHFVWPFHCDCCDWKVPPYIIGLSCKVWLPNLFQVEELQWRKKAFLSFRKWWCMTVYVCVTPTLVLLYLLVANQRLPKSDKN